MYELNRESILLALLGHDPQEPKAVIIYADAKPTDGTSQHKVVYQVLEGGINVGQGLSSYGQSWDTVLDFYLGRYAPDGVLMLVDGPLTGALNSAFISDAEAYLSRTGTSAATAVEPSSVDQNLKLGICRSPAEFSQHVSILAKDLSNFEFKYDHLAMVAALTLRFANVGDDLDLVKKASLYEDETKLQKVSPLFRQLMLDIFETDKVHGGGKSLVHPDALATLASDVRMRDMMHMLIGVIGEAGELAQAVHHFLTTGELKMSGKDSLPEEIGDARFFFSGLLRALGITEEDNNQMNYNKLKARYPAGYSNEAALNRDLAAEDQALRGN